MSRWLVWPVLLGLAIGMTSCASGAARGTAGDAGGDVALGLTVFTVSQQLPSMSGTTLTGQRLTASSYAARSPLVINVWASWCSPCRRELPLLARVSRHGVRVLGIDERDRASAARAFAHSRGATYPSLVDPEGSLLAKLRVLPQVGIPSTLVVAGDGHIAARIVGALTPMSLRRALARAGS